MAPVRGVATADLGPKAIRVGDYCNQAVCGGRLEREDNRTFVTTYICGSAVTVVGTDTATQRLLDSVADKGSQHERASSFEPSGILILLWESISLAVALAALETSSVKVAAASPTLIINRDDKENGTIRVVPSEIFHSAPSVVRVRGILLWR